MSFLGSTGVYAYTTLISLFVCVPLTIIVEGPQLMAGYEAAVAALGMQQFLTSLASVGLLYHLYNQVSATASSACSPLCQGRRSRARTKDELVGLQLIRPMTRIARRAVCLLQAAPLSGLRPLLLVGLPL
jgi:hypothetical protein